MDLVNELNLKFQELYRSISNLKLTGSEYAQSEREYKIKLRQECLKLRDEKMAIGMIDKTCYGIQSVADLRLARDSKEAMYKANQELINALKLEIRIIESQLDREFRNS